MSFSDCGCLTHKCLQTIRNLWCRDKVFCICFCISVCLCFEFAIPRAPSAYPHAESLHMQALVRETPPYLWRRGRGIGVLYQPTFRIICGIYECEKPSATFTIISLMNDSRSGVRIACSAVEFGTRTFAINAFHFCLQLFDQS